MKCPFCNTENVEGAVYCKHCGKPLSQGGVVCPSCQSTCPPIARFCFKCGAQLNGDAPKSKTQKTTRSAPKTEAQKAPMPEIEAKEVPVSEEAKEAPMPAIEAQETQQVAPMPETELQKELRPAASAQEKRARRRIDEQKQKRLSLVSGILMMCGVFFALIFVFFIGVEYQTAGAGYSGRNETYTVWHYFGRVYALLESSLSERNYSAYTIAASYIPVVLSTIVAAGTLAATVTFALLAAVKFGLHFKNSETHYFKFAVAAVFSFMLGATLFDCIHSTSTPNDHAALSGTTVTGMVFCCLIIIASLVIRTISIGDRFKKRQAVLDCVCTLIGILFLAMTSGSADAAQADYTFMNSYRSPYSIGLFQLNRSLSLLYTAKSGAEPAYISMFVLALLAIMAQIAVQVLTFVILIRRIGNYTEKRVFSLKLSIVLAAVSAMYLIFSAISLEFANYVVASGAGQPKLWLSSAPIMTLVSSILHLAVAITHKTIARKDPEESKESAEEEPTI